MKLNADCIKDILISVEANTGYNIFLSYPDEHANCPNLDKYTAEEIMHHINQCEKSRLVDIQSRDLSGNINISDLSPKGHEFLANIRKDTIWNKTKSISNKIGATSLSAFI